MKKTAFILLITFIFIGALGFVPARCNTALALMVELGLEDLTNESASVVRGEVTDIKSEWNENKTKIYTYITLSVKDTIKGEIAQRTVTIKQLGGKVGRKKLTVSNSAIFKKGENVVMFLKPETDPQRAGIRRSGGRSVIHNIVGKEQGKYTVSEDSSTGKKTLIMGGGIFGTREGRIVSKAGSKIDLEDFTRQIKSIKNRRHN